MIATKLFHRVRGLIAFLMLIVVQVASTENLSAAVVSFQDANFNPSDWTSTKYVDTTPGQSATFVTTTMASGGLPGSYQQVLLTLREGLIRTSHLRASGASAFKWNPSTQGAFTFVDYSFNLVMTNYYNPAPNTPASEAGAVGYALLVSQGGQLYIAMTEIANTAQNKQWVSINRTNFTASSFNRVNSNGLQVTGDNPNFSASGGEITFGYAMGVSHGSSGVFKATESGIDNYSLTLHNGDNGAAVPEPATATLTILLFGIAGVASAKRKHGQSKDNPVR